MFVCPHCGELVPDNAACCPSCGSDDETGWNPEADYLSVDLPEEREEPPDRGQGVSTSFALTVIVVALLGLVALAGFSSLSRPYALFAALLAVVAALYLVRRHTQRGP